MKIFQSTSAVSSKYFKSYLSSYLNKTFQVPFVLAECENISSLIYPLLVIKYSKLCLSYRSTSTFQVLSTLRFQIVRFWNDICAQNFSNQNGNRWKQVVADLAPVAAIRPVVSGLAVHRFTGSPRRLHPWTCCITGRVLMKQEEGKPELFPHLIFFFCSFITHS